MQRKANLVLDSGKKQLGSFKNIENEKPAWNITNTSPVVSVLVVISRYLVIHYQHSAWSSVSLVISIIWLLSRS